MCECVKRWETTCFCVTEKFETLVSWILLFALSFLSLSFHSVRTVHEDAVSTPGVCSQEQRGSLSSGRTLPKKEDGSLFILWKRAIEEKGFVGVGSRLAYLGRTVFGRLPGGKEVSLWVWVLGVVFG